MQLAERFPQELVVRRQAGTEVRLDPGPVERFRDRSPGQVIVLSCASGSRGTSGTSGTVTGWPAGVNVRSRLTAPWLTAGRSRSPPVQRRRNSVVAVQALEADGQAPQRRRHAGRVPGPGGDLVALRVRGDPPEDRADAAGQRRDQVRGLPVPALRAADGLAVDRDHEPTSRPDRPGPQPRAQDPVEDIGAEQGERAPAGGLARRPAVRAEHGQRRRPTARSRRTTLTLRSPPRSPRRAARPEDAGDLAFTPNPLSRHVLDRPRGVPQPDLTRNESRQQRVP